MVFRLFAIDESKTHEDRMMEESEGQDSLAELGQVKKGDKSNKLMSDESMTGATMDPTNVDAEDPAKIEEGTLFKDDDAIYQPKRKVMTVFFIMLGLGILAATTFLLVHLYTTKQR